MINPNKIKKKINHKCAPLAPRPYPSNPPSPLLLPGPMKLPPLNTISLPPLNQFSIKPLFKVDEPLIIDSYSNILYALANHNINLLNMIKPLEGDYQLINDGHLKILIHKTINSNELNVLIIKFRLNNYISDSQLITCQNHVSTHFFDQIKSDMYLFNLNTKIVILKNSLLELLKNLSLSDQLKLIIQKKNTQDKSIAFDISNNNLKITIINNKIIIIHNY